MRAKLRVLELFEQIARHSDGHETSSYSSGHKVKAAGSADAAQLDAQRNVSWPALFF